MTRRFVRACEDPHVSIIGHPTTRQLGRRRPVDVGLDELFAACARTGTALEINAFPDRLDVPDEHISRARRHGVRFAVNTDAHSPVRLGHMRVGVGIGQRGWLSADEVLNTWPPDHLRGFTGKTPARRNHLS